MDKILAFLIVFISLYALFASIIATNAIPNLYKLLDDVVITQTQLVNITEQNINITKQNNYITGENNNIMKEIKEILNYTKVMNNG